MSIRHTVHEAMATNGLNGYTGQAQPVVAALEEREYQIGEALISFAQERGLSEFDARGALTSAGLDLRPRPTAVSNDSEQSRTASVMDALSDLRAKIADLERSITRR